MFGIISVTFTAARCRAASKGRILGEGEMLGVVSAPQVFFDTSFYEVTAMPTSRFDS